VCISQTVERTSFRMAFLNVCDGICTLEWFFLAGTTAFPRIRVAVDVLYWNSVQRVQRRDIGWGKLR